MSDLQNMTCHNKNQCLIYKVWHIMGLILLGDVVTNLWVWSLKVFTFFIHISSMLKNIAGNTFWKPFQFSHCSALIVFKWLKMRPFQGVFMFENIKRKHGNCCEYTVTSELWTVLHVKTSLSMSWTWIPVICSKLSLAPLGVTNYVMAVPAVDFYWSVD